jgi:hypothetical protein
MSEWQPIETAPKDKKNIGLSKTEFNNFNSTWC